MSGDLAHLKQLAQSYAAVASTQDIAETLAWAVEQLTPPTSPEPMPGWWVILHEVRDDLAFPDEIRHAARQAIDYADKLRRQILTPPTDEVRVAQTRCRSEVEEGRIDEIDEWVLEYVRDHSTDPFAQEMANRAAERRDED